MALRFILSLFCRLSTLFPECPYFAETRGCGAQLRKIQKNTGDEDLLFATMLEKELITRFSVKFINIDKYRNYCLENKLISHSAEFFKSSAETSFQYLMKNYEFIEDHTALSDALIEKEILTKALKKGKIEG